MRNAPTIHKNWFYRSKTHTQKFAIFAIALVLVCLVEQIDYLTGPKLVFTFFYLAPVSMVTWFCSTSAGIIMSALSGYLSVFADVYREGGVNAALVAWFNVLLRFGVFAAVTGTLGRLKKEAERKQQHYEKIARLSEIKSEFVATVSHELRTPLTAIKESAEILHRGAAGPLQEEQRTYMAIIVRNIERLRRLINDVLDFSKMEAGRYSLNISGVDLRELISEVTVSERVVAAAKGLSIRIETGDLPAIVRCDGDAVARVLANLMSNAVKYTKQGEIRVVAGNRQAFVEVSVTDTGKGIAREDMRRLFEPFERVRSSDDLTQGAGLGLVISRRIIEQHGGKMWIESEYEKGTRVSFSLPL